MRRNCLLLCAAIFCSGQMCASPAAVPDESLITPGYYEGPVATRSRLWFNNELWEDQSETITDSTIIGSDGLPTYEYGSPRVGEEVTGIVGGVDATSTIRSIIVDATSVVINADLEAILTFDADNQQQETAVLTGIQTTTYHQPFGSGKLTVRIDLEAAGYMREDVYAVMRYEAYAELAR